MIIETDNEGVLFQLEMEPGFAKVRDVIEDVSLRRHNVRWYLVRVCTEFCEYSFCAPLRVDGYWCGVIYEYDSPVGFKQERFSLVRKMWLKDRWLSLTDDDIPETDLPLGFDHATRHSRLVYSHYISDADQWT